ncbi:hypothetical protein J4050_05060 [Winogradskyella sp. DF17]|uniref:Gliding motility-associated protein GldM N-terminal domain-containing protein n=1 Tax=Winogradskyella pelagia TaxID=2819984 RepID=A0ABS3T0X5_9FLAO|nr:DUF6090 family protein [Winogradskyella sp. DF17]MBO3116104.1 hypothetical protein [Winogradskyella sp. DF17]
MIKFFRHIRLLLLKENQMGKYFKYAIGEIVLVVIGILIALQINNWNEHRKKNIEQQQLLKSIQAELEADVQMLNAFLEQTRQRQQTLEEESKILSSSSFKTDSLVNFIRKDIYIYFQNFQGFNNNTYTSAKSSGKIEIINDEVKKELFDLSVMQEQVSKSDTNYHSVVLTETNNLMRRYPFDLPFTYINKGDANALMWSKVDKKDLALQLNLWGTSKANLYRIRLREFQEVLEKTESILQLLESTK